MISPFKRNLDALASGKKFEEVFPPAKAKPREKMRISADRSDKAFRIDAFRFEAFLDGEPLPDCITADEETGEAVCFIRGEGGKLLYDAATSAPLRETRRGTVEIRKREDGQQ